MPNTRKRTADIAIASSKKQKTSPGAKKNLPDVKVDEGFSEDGKLTDIRLDTGS